MKRGWLIALGIIVGIALVVLGVLDHQYCILRAAPRRPHEAYAPARSSFRLALDPEPALPLMQRMLADQDVLPVPARWMKHFMPYEVVLMADPDVSARQTDMVVYINERRLGTFIAAQGDASGFFPTARWETPNLVRERRGVLLQEGTTPITPQNLDLLHEFWGMVAPLSPLELEGGHLMEAVVDLRDGRGFLLLADWLGGDVTPDTITHPTQLVHFLKNVATLRVMVNLLEEPNVSVQLRIACRPEATESEINSLRFLINTTYAQLQQTLEAQYGLSLQGGVDVDGLDIHGNYILSPVDRLLPALGIRF